MVTMVGLRSSFGLRRQRATLMVAVVAAASCAAGFEELIALTTGGWSWVELAQSATRNCFFALLLVGAVAVVGAPRARPVAEPARTQPRRDPVSADQLVRELSAINHIANELGMSGEVGRDGDCKAFDYLDCIRWGLANYVLRADRTRRLVNPPSLLVEVAVAEDVDGDLSRATGAVQTRADELAGQVRYTNTVVPEWLVAHRVALANPCYLDSNALFDRYRHGEMDPSAIAEDPLYLLICHLHDVLEVVEDSGELDDPALDHLQAQLTLPLRAVQHEVEATMAYQAAAIGLTRAVARVRAS